MRRELEKANKNADEVKSNWESIRKELNFHKENYLKTIQEKEKIYINKMFYNCSSLTYLNLSNFNTNNVTNMSYMFYNCSSLNSLNLSNFNTNNVKNISCMFYGVNGKNCKLICNDAAILQKFNDLNNFEIIFS